MDAGSWFAALNADVATLASQSGEAHALLHDFLMT